MKARTVESKMDLLETTNKKRLKRLFEIVHIRERLSSAQVAEAKEHINALKNLATFNECGPEKVKDKASFDDVPAPLYDLMFDRGVLDFPDENDMTLLSLAVKENHMSIIRLLAEAGMTMKNDGLLWGALEEKIINLELVKELFKMKRTFYVSEQTEIGRVLSQDPTNPQVFECLQVLCNKEYLVGDEWRDAPHHPVLPLHLRDYVKRRTDLDEICEEIRLDKAAILKTTAPADSAEVNAALKKVRQIISGRSSFFKQSDLLKRIDAVLAREIVKDPGRTCNMCVIL